VDYLPYKKHYLKELNENKVLFFSNLSIFNVAPAVGDKNIEKD
jgi:hypothetical protein